MVTWEELERKVNTLEKWVSEMHRAGIRGILGIPLDYPLKKIREMMDDISRRRGSPESWKRELDFWSREMYRLAKGKMEELILKRKMRMLGKNCIITSVWEPSKERMIMAIQEPVDGFEKISEDHVPCKEEEPPEVCNTRVLEKAKKRYPSCLILARRVEVEGRTHNIVVDPVTLHAQSITQEAEEKLKEMKRELEIE